MKHAASFENLKDIYIGTTEKCNLSCVMCPCNGPDSSIRRIKTLTPVQVKKIIDGLGGAKEIQFGGGTGEFLLDKNAPDYIRYAKDIGHFPRILTNGQLLTGELTDKLLSAGCRKFTFSVDAINADEYAKIRRGGDFNKVLDALAYLKQKKTEYPDIITTVSNVLLSEYNEDMVDEYCRFWNGRTDFVCWQALTDDNFTLQNLIREKPEEKDRSDCKLEIIFLPSGYMYPCVLIMYYGALGKIDWLPHIDSFTPAEAWDYFNESYKTENSPLWNICRQCKLWPMYYRDKTGNSPNYLQIKLENPAPLPNNVLYKKTADALKNDLQYNKGSKPHIATPFFASPLAEKGQELFVAMQFEKPSDTFTVVVQNALYDQLAVKTVNTGGNTVHLAFNIYLSCEELRLVFYPVSGIVDDFVPSSLEVATNGVTREFLRYIKARAEMENAKARAEMENAKAKALVAMGNTILRKGKRFLKGVLNG